MYQGVDPAERDKATSRGTGYIVLAVPLGILALLVLSASVSAFTCESEHVKECLADEYKPDVLIAGLVAGALLLSSSAVALLARVRRERRPMLKPLLIGGTLIAMAAFGLWFVIFAAAGIASTT